MTLPSASPSTVTIIGHRGAAGLAPENSLSAIGKALAIGCERIEIDVHQTADSILVVMHDETINRTTNGKGRIRNMTYEALLSYSINPLYDSSAEKIPSLEEVIAAVNGRAGLLIELKQGNDYYPGIEERLAGIIRKHDAASWCMVQSFNKEVLARMSGIAPELPLHQLLISSYFTDVEQEKHISEAAVFSSLLSKKFIDRMHACGKRVNVWTVNSKKEMEYFIRLGVDGIITDYPNLAKEVINELAIEQ